jgi:hypothetical protein
VIASESWGWRATGPRAALLAAGVCTPAHFPTAPKRIAHGATSDGDGHWRVKLVSRGRWELMVSPSAEDCEVLRSQARERAVLAERAEQLALAQRLGPEAWRERRIDSMAVSFELVRDGFAGRFGSSAGFRLSDRSMRDLNAMLRRLELLVSNAEVLPDQSLSAPPDGPAKAGRPPRLRAPLHLVRDGC